MTLCCIECMAESDEEARGWRIYLDEDCDLPGELVIATYCQECAVREFGPIRSE